jgi:tetratricopeptide (TPR) repeat protein
MIKALFIGCSNYPPRKNPLWRVRRDLETMQAVLEAAIARDRPPESPQPAVVSVIDRPRQETKAAIKEFFAHLTEADSAILVFSGYGFLEPDGQLHFVVCPDTETIPESLLDDPDSFISAQTVRQAMDNCPAQHQVVILDCNFRTSFATPADAAADESEQSLELGEQLGGDRRVILTSSIAVQPMGEPDALSADHDREGVWSYLRYLAEGIATGAADQDIDGKVSAAELHAYAKQKLVTAAPASEAQILNETAEAGNTPILSVPEADSTLYYRQMLEKHRLEDSEINEAGTQIVSGRATLKTIQASFNLAPEPAESIEIEVLRPVREFRRRQQVYSQRFAELMQDQTLPNGAELELAQLQRRLNLTAGDVAALSTLPPSPQPEHQTHLMRYESVYLAALQRQNPLNQQDRQVLAALKQTLHLQDQEVEAIHQRLNGQPESKPAVPIAALRRGDDRSRLFHSSHHYPAAELAFPSPPQAFSPAVEPALSNSLATEVQGGTQVQSPAVTEPAPNLTTKVVAPEVSQPSTPDGESTLVARQRRQRTLLRTLLAAALLFGLAAFLYSKRLFPFSNMGQPIDQATAQKFNQWGEIKAQEGYNGKAIDDYTRAIELNPNNTLPYVNRGVSNHRLGRLDNAIKDYDTAIALDPKLAKAYSNRSHVYYDKGDFSRALDDANRAVVLDPTLAEAYLNLGNAQAATGEVAGALTNYNRAINLTPEPPLLAAAYTNRGNLIARTDVNAAFKDYGKAIANNPNFAEIYFNRGLGYEKIGDRTAAIRDHEKAASLFLRQGFIPQQQEALKRIKFLRETTPAPNQTSNRLGQLPISRQLR